jgi:predicted DNA-binding transcriptional regulator YafY
MDKNFERLLATLSMVPTNSALSTSEIHRRLQVRGLTASSRTVQRDLESLAARFGIECDIRTKPYGWRWPKDRVRLSVPEMEWPEALSFRLLQDYLSGLLPASVSYHLQPYFAQAREKLGAHFDAAPIRRWPDKVKVISPGPALIPPKVKRSVHETVTEALLGEFQMTIDYRNVGGTSLRSHRIHPLGLVLEGGVLYLVASFFDYAESRILAMHRINKAVMLDERCETPPGFSLARYVDEGGFGCGGEDLIKLDATWRQSTGIHLLQAHLATDQVAEELGDGAVRIRATIRHTERLVWWLLGFGQNVEVHAPRALRQDIADRHREAAAQYAAPKTRRKPAAST